MDETSLVELTSSLVATLIEKGKIEPDKLSKTFEEMFAVLLSSYKTEVELKKELGVLETFSPDEIPDFVEHTEDIFSLPDHPEDQTRFD